MKKELDEKSHTLNMLQSSIVTPDLVKSKGTTFTEFDPVRFKYEGKDRKIGYFYIHNWVFIGSLGDPETWDGSVA